MIKVTLGEAKTQEKEFPKLMQDQYGNIFYFVRERYGLPINDNGERWSFRAHDFANFSGSDRTFTDYNSPITICNE